MLLTDFLSAIGIEAEGTPAAAEVKDITCDSRRVSSGSVFFAISGAKEDGAKYVDDAIKKGAVAVISGESKGESRAFIVKNVRLALSKAAKTFYPEQPEDVAAVTGTDGKTSTVNFVRQLVGLMNMKCVSIGTLGVVGDGGKVLSGYEGMDGTTPDPVSLHKALQDLKKKGCLYAAIEASSHGLHQYRLDSVMLKAAGFTVFSQDHLDYHNTMDEYFHAKMRLFAEVLPEGKTAVINADDAKSSEIEAVSKGRKHNVISYGLNGREIKVISAKATSEGTALQLEVAGKKVETMLNLAGDFQVGNSLCAAGLAAGLGFPLEELLEKLSELKPVRGRLEQVASGIYVDYAHTPNALMKVISALKNHSPKRIGVVFGCGGDRDKAKRPLMGKAASELADFVVVTDDNPRTENAAEIRKQVMAGCSGAVEIGDRHKAIEEAVNMMRSGDILLIAGKGHEDYQIIGTTKFPFDDAAIVREILHISSPPLVGKG